MKRTSNVSKKFRAAALATLVATMPLILSTTGCFDGGSKGGSGTEDVSNDNGGDTGGDTGGDDGSTIVDDNGVERIVLAKAFNTSAAHDIEPYKIQTEEVYSENISDPSSPNYYNEDFNTLYFDRTKLEEGKKYIFVGTTTADGEVRDRVFIPTGATKNVDILVKNAILDLGGTQGINNFSIDVPGFTYTGVNGTLKGYLYEPLDKVPVLTIGAQSGTDTITAPLGAKKKIAGVISSIN